MSAIDKIAVVSERNHRRGIEALQELSRLFGLQDQLRRGSLAKDRT